VTFELTQEETTAVLRWVPHLEADRLNVFGSRPNATMRVEFDTGNSRDIATAQILIAVRALTNLRDEKPYKIIGTPAPIIADHKSLTHLIGRFQGISQATLDELEERVMRRAAERAADDDKGIKH
jgi:hypothetical protein